MASDYQLNTINKEGFKWAIWSKQQVKGPQDIYLRGDFYFQTRSDLTAPEKYLIWLRWIFPKCRKKQLR